MNQKITIILLFFIIVIASTLRLYKLGSVPPSPDWDEAALGYNAYSIMLTGKDEYGKLLPLILRSFDDYKPGLYAYFIIPFIKIFELNIFSVRFPSVLFGIGTVLITYFLVKELFQKYSLFKHLALLSSFLLAISPWHIQFSRIAFESNVGVFFNAATVLFFLKGLKNNKYLFLSSLLAGINLYVYQSEKVFTPILMLLLITIFWKNIIKISIKYLFFSILIGVIVVLPLVQYLITDNKALSRAQGVSIFADQTQLLKENSKRLIIDKENNDLIGLILDNRRILFAKTILAGYLSHFDLNWLFITGDIARHHAPNMGILYLWELPFLIFGIYVLLFSTLDKKIKLLITLWLLIVPLPASITSGVPHAVRTLNFLPILQIIIALGLLTALRSVTKISNLGILSNLRYSIFSLLFLLFIFNFLYYLNQYFIQQNYFYSQEWQYGYQEAIENVKILDKKYNKIIVSNKPHLDQSYIFFLFYLQYSPVEYQKQGILSSGGFRENHYFDKYEFRPIEWGKEEKNKNILYVGRPDDFSIDAKVLKTINFLDGKPAIKIVEG